MITPQQKAYMRGFGDHLLRPLLQELIASLQGHVHPDSMFPGFENPESLPADFGHSCSVATGLQLPRSGDTIIFRLTIGMQRLTPEDLHKYLESAQSGGAEITFDKGIVQG